jgi:hypothetical protein
MVEVMSHEVNSASVNHGEALDSVTSGSLEIPPPHSQTIDYVGIVENELHQLSFFVGGSATKLIAYSEHSTFGREIGGAIMRWGDLRLTELLAEVTKSSGYDYGAEQIQVVALTATQAVLFNVVPKVLFDPDIVQDDEGNIVKELVYLAIPEENPNIIFYSWDEEGKNDLDHRLQAGGPFAWPWVDGGNYWLAFSIATNYKDVIVMDHLEQPVLPE